MIPKLLAAFEAHETIREQEKVRIDILKRFGYYSTESNGHLSEYVAWYRKRPDEIKDWISTGLPGSTEKPAAICVSHGKSGTGLTPIIP